MEKSQLWTIIGVTIVVAVIASLATVSLTGNTIKVGSSFIGTEVYTKGEIDTKFLAVGKELLKRNSKQEVLDMLSRCRSYVPPVDYNGIGDSYCKDMGLTCALSIVSVDTDDVSRDVFGVGCKNDLQTMLQAEGLYRNSTSSNYISAYVNYLCCSP